MRQRNTSVIGYTVVRVGGDQVPAWDADRRHGVEGPQRNVVARQSGQCVGHEVQGLSTQGLDGFGSGIARSAGVKHAVDDQPLIAQTQAMQLLGGARGERLTAGIAIRSRLLRQQGGKFVESGNLGRTGARLRCVERWRQKVSVSTSPEACAL